MSVQLGASGQREDLWSELHGFYCRKELIDCLLVCQDGLVMAHRLIVSMASPCLHSCLRSTEDKDASTVILPESKMSDIERMLAAIYGRFSRTQGKEDQWEELSRHLGICDIRSKEFSCDRMLKNSTDTEVTSDVVDTVDYSEVDNGVIDMDCASDENNRICENTPADNDDGHKESLDVTDNFNQYHLCKHVKHINKSSCEMCKKEFKNVKQHMQQVHGDDLIKNVNDDHIKVVMTKGAYICPECGKALKSDMSWRKHRYRHREARFPCQQCHKKFFFLHDYKNHMNVHAGIKEHVCETCGAKFSSGENLASHRYWHFKKHRCDICGKYFALLGKLKTHKNIHSNTKPYSCIHCVSSFADDGALRRHVKSVHEGRKYTCDSCGKQFTQAYDLTRHKQKEHLNSMHLFMYGANVKHQSRVTVHMNQNLSTQDLQ